MIDGHRVSAIITCAGRSVRFGSNKLLATIDDRTILEMTVRRFVHPMIDEIVVTVSPENHDAYRRILVVDAELPVRLVLGAEERFLSAQRGLQATDGSLILVHDGVRPFVTGTLIEDALRAGSRHGAAMLGLPSVVQVKMVTDEEYVHSSLDRSRSWLGQTPQVFRRDLLETAYTRAIADSYSRVSDDADLVAEYTRHPVKIVRGHENNIKITTRMDLFVARHIASELAPLAPVGRAE
jgi:2-C-methyl-D-erythritol 4-phosphate cytidylyltransferase